MGKYALTWVIPRTLHQSDERSPRRTSLSAHWVRRDDTKFPEQVSVNMSDHDLATGPRQKSLSAVRPRVSGKPEDITG